MVQCLVPKLQTISSPIDFHIFSLKCHPKVFILYVLSKPTCSKPFIHSSFPFAVTHLQLLYETTSHCATIHANDSNLTGNVGVGDDNFGSFFPATSNCRNTCVSTLVIQLLQLFVAAGKSLLLPRLDYGILHSNLLFTLSLHQEVKLFTRNVSA